MYFLHNKSSHKSLDEFEFQAEGGVNCQPATKNGFWVVFLRYFGVLDSYFINRYIIIKYRSGAQWLGGRVLDLRPRGCGFEPYRRHCIVSLSKNIDPSLVLVQPRKTGPFITERLLMGHKESNQTNKNKQNKIQVKIDLR